MSQSSARAVAAEPDPHSPSEAQGLPDWVVRDLTAAADYLRMMGAELSRLGANEISKERVPAACRELSWIIEETGQSSNVIMGAAEDVMAARDLDDAAFKDLVAERMTQIFVACAFQDLAAQRAQRIQSTLGTIERRLSRIASVVGSQNVPDIVDPGAQRSADSARIDQSRIDEIFEEWPGVEWG